MNRPTFQPPIPLANSVLEYVRNLIAAGRSNAQIRAAVGMGTERIDRIRAGGQ